MGLVISPRQWKHLSKTDEVKTARLLSFGRCMRPPSDKMVAMEALWWSITPSPRTDSEALMTRLA